MTMKQNSQPLEVQSVKMLSSLRQLGIFLVTLCARCKLVAYNDISQNMSSYICLNDPAQVIQQPVQDFHAANTTKIVLYIQCLNFLSPTVCWYTCLHLKNVFLYFWLSLVSSFFLQRPHFWTSPSRGSELTYHFEKALTADLDSFPEQNITALLISTLTLSAGKAQKLWGNILQKLITRKKFHKFLRVAGFYSFWIIEFKKTIMLTQTFRP